MSICEEHSFLDELIEVWHGHWTISPIPWYITGTKIIGKNNQNVWFFLQLFSPLLSTLRGGDGGDTNQNKNEEISNLHDMLLRLFEILASVCVMSRFFFYESE